jgi:deoxyribonuclease IV
MYKVRKIGVHTSVAGGLPMALERARGLGCNTMQIFSHNPRGWSVKKRDTDEIQAFVKARKKLGIAPVFVHSSYLINLASGSASLAAKSVDMVIQELDIADSIGAEYVVLHTGSASGEDAGIARRRAIARLSDIARRGEWRTGLLLENTAGERGDITSRVEDIAEIMDRVPRGLVSGICIDTCHAFSAGYNIRNEDGIQLLSADIIRYIGKSNLRLLHLNDAKGALGAGLDRHEHIGKGKIGIRGFRLFLKHKVFSDVPIILETPKKSPDDDLNNLGVVKKLFCR